MKELEKSRHEKIVGEGWFNGSYTEKSARLVSEMQGLSLSMVQYWYGVKDNKRNPNYVD